MWSFFELVSVIEIVSPSADVVLVQCTQSVLVYSEEGMYDSGTTCLGMTQ